MTQPGPGKPPGITRPAIGILVDPARMAAARKSAMLERIELAHLSQALDLARLAAANGIDTGGTEDVHLLRKILTDAGVSLKQPGLRIGVSRDEIAKLETAGRKRPKITTLDKLIGALNHARAARGKPPLDVEDLQVPGEVLTKTRPLARDIPTPDAPLTDLGLSTRVRKKLYGAGISTIGQLASRGSGELAGIPGLGVKGIDEIVAAIARHSEPVADWEQKVMEEQRSRWDKEAAEAALAAYQEAQTAGDDGADEGCPHP